jgi:hypothetical protein
LPWLAWNLDPPDLRLWLSLGRQMYSTAPSYWLRWDLTNSLTRLAWNRDPLHFSLPSS